MKAIIHIGTPKSGTTTIQSFLSLNRTALAEQGIRYAPYNYGSRRKSQMDLALAGVIHSGGVLNRPLQQHAMGVTGHASQAAYVDGLEKQLRDGVAKWPEHTYLASSEQNHAWAGNRKRIKAFDTFLRSIFDEVRYVVYYRPQDEFMLSTYSERIRRGELVSFETHFEQRVDNMDLYHKTNLWAKIAGRENLTVRLLDRGVMKNGDLLDDFCDVAGLDRAPLQTPARMNVSLSAEEIKLYLKIGKRFPARLQSGARNPLFFGLMLPLKRLLPKPGTRIRLSDAQRARIAAQTADTNERMRAEYFPDQATVFTPS